MQRGAAHNTADVSCEGMPLGSSRNRANHSLFFLPNRSTSAHPSAPQIAAHKAMATMSISRWRFVRIIRGSVRSSKCERITGVVETITSRPP